MGKENWRTVQTLHSIPQTQYSTRRALSTRVCHIVLSMSNADASALHGEFSLCFIKGLNSVNFIMRRFLLRDPVHPKA